MQNVNVTDRVWSHILDIRAGRACSCCGAWTSEEQSALDLYAPLARRDLGQMIVGQIGQSLDGRIATVAGDARDVSGPDGLCHLHRMRALVDAVVIGVRTALHDKPRLSVRLCGGDNPARVVIDPRGRLPDDTPVFRPDGSRRIVVQAVSCRRPPGVEVLRLPKTPEGRLDPSAILDELDRAGLSTVLIEGGGITIGHFLEAELLSRLQVAVSPLLIGGGPAGLNTRNPVTRLADAIRPETRVFGLGSDILFDCALTATARLATQPLHSDPLDSALQS
ncbi:MAG: RibD family protein [Pseudomonadota bacterium]